MAAIAITKPTERKKIIRAQAPVTGGVRHPCLFCDMKEYSTLSKQEQRELFALQEDIIEIWETNHSLANKLKSMNDDEIKIKKMNYEMQVFLDQIPPGNLTATIATQTDQVSEIAVDNNNNAEVTDVKKVWVEKEIKLQHKVIDQQKKLISDLKSIQPVVPKELWGHRSRTWSRRSRKNNQPPTSSQRSSQKSSKPFSIPFCPKPLHLMVRKAYLKSPPKLPPAHSYTDQPTARLPQCGSLTCDDNINTVLREMFADALERAVNSNEEPASDVPGDSWANHPYYDDADPEEDQQDAAVPDETCEGEAWEDHPYYDDLGSPETDHGDEELDTPALEEDQQGSQLPDEAPSDDQQDEAASDDQQNEVAWEDHPYYDTPEEEVSHAESDDSEEDVAWEDSPYY